MSGPPASVPPAALRLQVEAPGLGLSLALPPGAAVELTAAPDRAGQPGHVTGDLDAVVDWLAGRRGPWRPGALRLDGRRLGHRRTAARARAGLLEIATPALAPEVAVRDHLAVVAAPARVDALLATTPKLAGRADDPAGLLSGGERQMVAWARAALVEPRVVLLDRAGTGLDVEARGWASERLTGWRGRGCVALVRVGRTEEAAWATRTPPNGRAPGPHG